MNIPLNIDWQQILLHLFNFLILFGGLYILLYKPVKDFMKKRVDYYADMENSAKENLNASESKKAEYDEKLKDVEAEIEKIKADAVKEAEKITKERLKTAEEEKIKIIEEAKRNAQAQKNKILAEANSQIEEMVSEAVDRVMPTENKNSFDEFLEKAEKE